jgi:diaminohydroxyphosphoribosylaminopyrimidine deaminase / 5-amino-6-(5-phosphoribosylamino)uracil reductase
VTDDERYMQMALQVATLGCGQTSPNPLVGAVVVKNGRVIGQGAHLRAGGPHAEVHALSMAGEHAVGSTVYVTLEPCSHYGRTPPCADALIRAGVQRVVIAAGDPNPEVHGGGIAKLSAAGVTVTRGVLEHLALEQNEAYMTWRRNHRPFVVWKCAATLDGWIAATSGHSKSVTSSESRAEVHALRRQYPAIGVGIGTVLADNPRLTVRSKDTVEDHQPTRVVFDGRYRIPTQAAMFAEPGHTIVYTTLEGQRDRNLRGELSPDTDRVHTVVVPAGGDGGVSLKDALVDLGHRGMHSILMEGGSTLVTSLLLERLVDKVVYYVAPKLLVGGIPALRGHHTSHMDEAVSLDRVSCRTVGPDFCVTGYPRYDAGKP